MSIQEPNIDKRTHTVYALAFPNKLIDKIFYVGVSKVPGKRYGDHLRAVSGNNDKDDIIKDILNSGKKPRLLILEKGLSQSKAYTREKYWITQMEKQGHKLTNKTRGGKFPGIARYAAKKQKTRRKGK